MPWVRLDDAFPSHPKTLAAGPAGVALFISGLCWVSRNLTDGRIPKHVLPALLAEAGVKRVTAERLVAVGYWHDRGDHWEVNGYLERNPSRAKVEKERARWRSYKDRSASDSTAESTVESTVASALSHPDPYPSDLHQPPTPTVTGPATGRAEQVINHLLAVEKAQANGVKRPAAWAKTVRARLETEHGDRIRQLVDNYPTAPVGVLVAAVNGETASLRYYQEQQ